MPKRISKTDATKIIKVTDALEVLFEAINRADTPSSKQSALSRFIQEVQKQFKDERDVLLFSVKVK